MEIRCGIVSLKYTIEGERDEYLDIFKVRRNLFFTSMMITYIFHSLKNNVFFPGSCSLGGV